MLKLLLLSAILFVSFAVVPASSNSSFMAESSNHSLLADQDDEIVISYRQWESLSFLEKMRRSKDFAVSVLLVFALALLSTIAFWIAVIVLCCLCKCCSLYDLNADEFN